MLLLLGLGVSGQQLGAFNSPRITDDMTLNPDQNLKWRKGMYKYSAKPRSTWELGIHAGQFLIDGDVDRRLPGGFGVGLHLRKALQYVFSVRIDMFYGQAFCVDAQVWEHHTTGGGLVEEPIYDTYAYSLGWYPRVKTHYAYVAAETLINIGNILFHSERNKWNWYLILGAGVDTHQTLLDLYDANGDIYHIDPILDMNLDHDVRAERIMIKKEVDNLYDGKYETKGFQKEGIFRIADQYNVHLVAIGGMGIARKINTRYNIGLEYQFMATDNDYLDGMKYRAAGDQTNNVDIGHYLDLRLAINVGNMKRRSEPLYWLNPLDNTFKDIAELKQRPALDITDSDGDGVIDMMDMEPNSPVGSKVDTRGITLDSDGDGIADYLDKEPYSPPGFATDASGKTTKEDGCCITREEVREMIDSASITDLSVLENIKGEPDWWLPMIHFDLDKYFIKPEFYGDLKHVADMMKKYPDLCVTAAGHTDARNTNAYNEMLSYQRANEAISYLVINYDLTRDRFRLMYGGEDDPITSNLPDHHNISREEELKQYINRRVEFRTCLETDFDMPKPEKLSKAGQNTYGSSRKGSKYSGNKSSGY